MKDRTLVCVYGESGDAEAVFEKLSGLYRRRCGEDNVYCALIDMSEARLYRAAGDSDLESRAKNELERLSGLYGDRFFCGIRQRRCDTSRAERRYFCEGGALGALKEFWRYANGREGELFPCFGVLKGSFDRVCFFAPFEARKNEINGYGCDGTRFGVRNRGDYFDYGCDRMSVKRKVEVENDGCGCDRGSFEIQTAWEKIDGRSGRKARQNTAILGCGCDEADDDGFVCECVTLSKLALDSLLSSGAMLGDVLKSDGGKSFCR